MDINKVRSEFNHLLENVNKHSDVFTAKNHVPSIEVSVVLAMINKLQETACVLKYLIEQEEQTVLAERKTAPDDSAPVLQKKDVVQHAEPQEVIEVVAEQEVMPPKEIEKGSVEVEENTSIGEQFQYSPISKLVDAFSLNDRYLYANELFDKDMGAFNELVKIVDASDTYIIAKTHVDKLKNQYRWDVKNEFVKTFYKMVERRFI